MRFYAIFVQIFMRIFGTQKRIFQPASPLTRNPVTVDVHGGGNGAVTQLLLHVTGTLMDMSPNVAPDLHNLSLYNCPLL